jgi:thiamine-phosphate pyrophosphorylase
LPKLSDIKGVYRIIDANINRTKEGLRVCEEACRFVLRDRSLTARFKAVRHAIEGIAGALAPRQRMLAERESPGDVGRSIKSASELRRGGCRDVFFANMQRVKESVRVLEEFSKLLDRKAALEFKEIRYTVYELEKKAASSRAASAL